MCLILQSKFQVTKLNCSQLQRRDINMPPGPAPAFVGLMTPAVINGFQESPLSRLSLSHQGGFFSHCHLIPPCVGGNCPSASRTQLERTVDGVSILRQCGHSREPEGVPHPFSSENAGQGWGRG